MPLPKWELETGDTAMCTLCSASNRVRVFPAALFDRNAPTRAETALEGEAACFDHPAKRAVAACQQCGRFVCQVCAVEFGEGTWCPSCVAAGAGKAKPANPENSRILYDSTTLIVPLVALLLWPVTLAAAPATVVLALMRWSRPLSLVRRYRWRFVLAILIALAEMAAWLFFLYYVFTGRFQGAR